MDRLVVTDLVWRKVRGPEELIIHKFRNGTRAFVSVGERDGLEQERILASYTEMKRGAEPRPIHIEAGCELQLFNIQPENRRFYKVGESEEVTFICMEPVNGFRDGVRFSNGQEALLQFLKVGTRARLISRRIAIERHEEVDNLLALVS